MNYSIWYKDASGVTQRSDCIRFDSDDDAARRAGSELHGNAIIEVWKGDHLLTRLFRDNPGESTPAAAGAFAREPSVVASWENEGGQAVIERAEARR